MSLCMIVTRFAWMAQRFLKKGRGSGNNNKHGLDLRVLKEMHEECLCCFLQGKNGLRLPSQSNTLCKLMRDKVRCNFTDLDGKEEAKLFWYKARKW